MGMWGFGPFENDTALDWASELTASNLTPRCRSALKGVCGVRGRLFLLRVRLFGLWATDPADRAFAAADVIAAIASGRDVPAVVSQPVPDAYQTSLDDADLRLGLLAVDGLREFAAMLEDDEERAAYAALLAQFSRELGGPPQA